jgi:hypothetical protein
LDFRYAPYLVKKNELWALFIPFFFFVNNQGLVMPAPLLISAVFTYAVWRVCNDAIKRLVWQRPHEGETIAVVQSEHVLAF